MSSEDILYTNKFTISNDENINSKYSNNKKVQFRNNYEQQHGVPNDLLNNNDGSSSHDVDISSSNDGLYLIQLIQGEKKAMFKLVKE